MTTTMTISLPRELERRAKALARAQHRSMSELFREAFRVYETARPNAAGWNVSTPSWDELRRTMEELSQAGRKISLTEFLARDRQSH